MKSSLRLAASLLVASCSLPGQTVWNMGAPWPDLDQVIVMAAPGDVVRLNGMQFPPFTLIKGLTMIGPGTILPFTHAVLNQVTTFTIPPGQEAHVVNLAFTPHAVFGCLTNRVEARGRVTFERCSFGAGAPANLMVLGTILLHHCTVQGNAVNCSQDTVGGMHVLGGVCSVVNSTLRGGNSVFSTGYQMYTGFSTPALSVYGGTVLLSASSMTGGAGIAQAMFGPHRPGSPAVLVQLGTASISDCSLAGGASPSTLAGPVALAGNASTYHGRTTLMGGGGGPTGAPTSGAVQHLPQIVGMRVDPAFQLGGPTTITATSGSSQPLGMVASFDPTPTTHPLVIGPIFGSLAQLVPLVFTTPTPGLQVGHTIAVPNQPLLLGVGIHVQAYQLDGNLVRMSAGVGGVLH